MAQFLSTLLQLVADQKLKRPLGSSVDKAKPQLAENRRSGRSKRNIVLNLESARAFYAGADGTGGFSDFVRDAVGGIDADTGLKAALDRAIRTARALPEPLAEAVADPKRRPQVEAALAAVKAVQLRLRDAVPPAAGIKPGFNALDGD